MTQPRTESAVRKVGKGFGTELSIITIAVLILMAIGMVVTLERQKETMDLLKDLSTDFKTAVVTLERRQKVLDSNYEDQQRTSEAIKNGLDILSASIGEMTDALRDQKVVSKDLATAKRNATRFVPKKATQADINRLRKAIQ